MAGWINTPMPSEEWFWWRASRAATAAGLVYDIHTVWTAAPISSGLKTPITLL
jgi:hypothetical protein